MLVARTLTKSFAPPLLHTSALSRAVWRSITPYVYSAAARPFATLPPAISDRLCGHLTTIVTPRGQSERDRIAHALNCDDATAAGIAARARANTLRAVVDMTRWSAHPNLTVTDARIEGEEHLEAAVRHHNGAIVAPVHTIGYSPALWGALQIVVRHGFVVHAYGLPDRVFSGASLLTYDTPTPGSSRASRHLLDALRRGACLALMADCHWHKQPAGARATRHLVTHRFLNCDLEFPTGPATLARLAGSCIVPAVPLRTGPGQYVLRLFPALEPDPHGGQAGDRALMRSLLTILEAAILRHPDQYSHMYYPIHR